MNRNSVNAFLTDMMNISIESFELLQNEIIHIQNKNSFIIIPKDAFLSKEASNATRELCVSERAFCNWVGSRPVHIHTLNGPYQSSFGTEPELFSWVSVRLFGAHQSAIAVFTPAQKIRTKGGNEPEFVLIEPNKTGVNTP